MKFVENLRQQSGNEILRACDSEESELTRIREYIANNPHQWSLDRENPEKGVYQYAPTDGIEDIFGGIRP